MSVSPTAVSAGGGFSAPGGDENLLKEVRDLINGGRAHRRWYEPTWHSNLAFVAGKHDLVWDRYERRLALPPGLRGRDDLYIADVITEQRAAALGELEQADDRPQLLAVQSGEQAEDIAEHLNRCVEHAWTHEWDSEEMLKHKHRMVLDFGTCALRCHFDKSRGKPLLQVPHRDGKPILDPTEARGYVAEQHSSGSRAELRDINEGRTRWSIGSPFNLIVPPGIPHERDFPWECWVMPTPLEEVKRVYGSAAAELKEDGDISSILGLGAKENDSGQRSGTVEGSGEGKGRLRDHVWLFIFFRRPGSKYPKGQELVLGGGKMALLDRADTLPYRTPDGEYCSGIEYFHWWRLNDRFWGKAFVESLKDPQRLINRRRRQNTEITDRGLPKAFVSEGSVVHNPKGLPLEIVQLKQGSQQPVFHPGIGPGEWMYKEIAEFREDLSHASTLAPLRLGENPRSVDTYSQLALLNENEALKRSTILHEHQLALARLVVDSVWDIRTYWSQSKQLLVAGDEGRVQMVAFEKSKLPDFYVVRTPTGAAKPRSQAAELQKIQDVATFSVNSQQPLPVNWFAESLDAGEMAELPEPPASDATDVAQWENHLMLAGEQPQPAYYDPIEIHIPVHRQAQDQARFTGDQATYDRVETHVQAHRALAMENLAQSQSAAPQPSAGPGALPPPGAPAGPEQGAPPAAGAPAGAPPGPPGFPTAP